MKTVVLMMPTFNEKDNVTTLISAIEEVFQKLTDYRLKILVIDDHSPDGTAKKVQELAQKFNNITLVSKKKEGLGAAYLFGIKYALANLQPDIFIQIDADWQHNPLLLPDFFTQLELGADFVIGSRYMRGGSIPGNWGLHRKIYSILGNAIVRFGLGKLSPHDWTSGYRLYTRRVVEKVQDGLEKYSGYTFQVAFLFKTLQMGFKTAEVPLQFIDRTRGKSKIAPFDYIRKLLMYILSNSPFIKYLIIGVMGFSLQALISHILVTLHFFPGIAVVVGSLVAIVANFLGNNFWTFSHNKIQGLANVIIKFIHFLGTSIGAVILQFIVVSIGVYFYGQESWFLFMVFAIIFLVIPYNFFIYNRFIWRKK